ncbi:MAG TPA: OsmC family protein [Pseudonocardia sp.]
MGTTHRTVLARWTGGLRAEMDAGGFPVVSDEPESVGGTGTGPQPTELLLASIASCFTLAMAYSARKRGLDLGADTEVEVTGHYDGPQFDSFRIVVRTSSPSGAELTRLLESAERVCYVTRTLRASPKIEIVTE